MEQMHQEFQRLKSELDKLTSYSGLLKEADENVQETTSLIKNVNNKYETLVDLIWREFNEEIDSLKSLKEQITNEAKHVSETLKSIQLQSIETRQTGQLLAQELRAEKIFSPILHKLSKLENHIDKRTNILEDHFEHVKNANKQLETNITRNLTNQLRELQVKAFRFDDNIQNVIKTSLEENLSKVTKTGESSQPVLSNGVGKNIKEQLEQINSRIGRSDNTLKDIIKQSLSESAGHTAGIDHDILAKAISHNLSKHIDSHFKKLQQKLDDSSKSIAKLSSAPLPVEGASSVEPDAARPGLDALQKNLEEKFDKIQQKLGESGLAIKGFAKNVNDSVAEMVIENKNSVEKINKAVSNMKGGGFDNESVDTIKKVTRNQFQKLLDHERDMKKLSRLIGIGLVIGGLSILLLILLFVYINMNLG